MISVCSRRAEVWGDAGNTISGSWDPAGCKPWRREGVSGVSWEDRTWSQRVRFPTSLHVIMKVEPNKFERIV